MLADIESLPPEHPDAVAVRRATAGIFKSVKKARRHAKRDAVAAADHAVTAATATGAPGRIDDETAGLPLVSTAVGASRRYVASVARLLHVQEPLHGGRRVLPPTLSRSAPRSTAPSATPAPTSPAGAPCSPVAAPRSACTSRCDCSATAPTRRSPPAFRTTPCAASPRCPTVPTGCTGYASSGSTCATPLRSSRSRTPSPRRDRWTS